MKLFADGAHDLELADLLGESVAVLGIKGSGKSNTAARISEQGLEAGLPLTIVDIAGEYWGLKEKFALVVAGKSPHVDLELTSADQAAALALWSITERVSVILDLSGYKMDQRMELLQAYLETLWDKAGVLRRPYHIILEEARNWIPQGRPTPVKDVLISIATEGRKRGLGIVIIGQRSSSIDKNVLTQAGIAILHRVRFPTDIGVYREIIPRESAWVKKTVTGLATGEAVVVTTTDVFVAKVLERETYHAGYTPGMESVEPPTLTGIAPEMLAALNKLIQSDKPSAAGGDLKTRRESVRQDAATLTTHAQAIIVENQTATLVDLERQLAFEKQRFTEFVDDIWQALQVQGAWQYPGEAVQEVVALRGRVKPEFVPDVVVKLPVKIATASNGNELYVLDTPPAVPDPLDALLVERHRKRDDQMLNRQRRKLTELCEKISCQKMHHRLMLAYMIENEHELYTVEALGNALCYEPITITTKPPLELLNLGIIGRDDGSALDKQYWLEASIVNKFPDLEVTEIMAALQAACEVR